MKTDLKVLESERSGSRPVAPCTAPAAREGAALASAAMNYSSHHRRQSKRQKLAKWKANSARPPPGTLKMLYCLLRDRTAEPCSLELNPQTTSRRRKATDGEKGAALHNAISSGDAPEFRCRLCGDRGSAGEAASHWFPCRRQNKIAFPFFFFAEDAAAAFSIRPEVNNAWRWPRGENVCTVSLAAATSKLVMTLSSSMMI